jgi:HD superfamily phosphohydrolases
MQKDEIIITTREYDIDPYTRKNSKLINDAIHGTIELPNICFKLTDTPCFQRLRNIKQLGSTHFVFPGAEHSRFQHSIGVSHLARKMITQLKLRQPEEKIEKRDVQLITLAGLCHDLGHGPLSHAFDRWITERKGYKSFGKPPWSHELMSVQLLDYIIDTLYLDFERQDIRFIQDLILGERSGYKEKQYLFDIIANKRNGVDVDKFDYIQRDTYYCNISHHWSYKRTMKCSQIIGNEICYKDTEYLNLGNLFYTRYKLHKQVYTHPRSNIIELMFLDALTLADPYLKLSETVDDLEKYIKVTDGILEKIENSKKLCYRPAQEIISRIKTRNIYKLALEVIVPKKKYELLKSNPIRAEELVCCGNETHFEGRDCELKAEDIFIHQLNLNLSMGEENPMDHISFFSKYDPSSKFSISPTHVSSLIPNEHFEKIIRIIVKDPSKWRTAESAARRYFNEKLGIKI